MLNRRELLSSFAGAAVVFRSRDYPIRTPRVEPLWKSPEGFPNALEASKAGLWMAEQISDVAYLLDWETGKVIRKVPTESSNTSGMAFGGGFLWMAANGAGFRREPRPTDTKTREIIKVDAKTGSTVARYPVPGGGGVHGLTWADHSLWITTLQDNSLTRVDKDFNILHTIPVTLDRAHGLAAQGKSIWCVFSDDYVIQRLDSRDGTILEAIQLKKGLDPDPHGMTRHKGTFYYCDAGIAPGGVDNGSKYAGYICRIHL